MKILVITSSYPRFEDDSAAPFVKSICENLSALGNQVSVIAPYDIEVKGSQSNSIKVHRFKYIIPLKNHIMGHGRSLESDTQLRQLTHLLIFPFLLFSFLKSLIVSFKFKPDIIHVHWVLPNGPVAWLLSQILKIPYVVTLHGSDIFVAKNNRVFRNIAKMVFKKSSRITACSSMLAETAKSLGGDGKVVLLPWGADPLIFSSSLKSNNFRNKNKIPDGATLVLALGRMVYKKGFGSLVEVWPQVVSKFPKSFLMIGGDGPVRAELHDAIEKNIIQNIFLPGKISWSEVPEFLANGDLFVLPSIQDHNGNEDGLPTVLLEAMGSGLAIIASEIGGVPLVINNGRNGLLVEPGNSAQLLKAILQLLGNTETLKMMGRNARADVEEKYNWHNVAINLSQIFTIAITYSQYGKKRQKFLQ